MKCHELPIAFFSILALGAALPARAPAQTPLTTVRVASGLSQPLQVLAPPGDTERLFIVEQGGRIKILILASGQVLTPNFLNISSKTNGSFERGLLGMAFHPDYENNGFFYINYTNNSGNTVVERYSVSVGDPNVADANSDFLIIGPINQPFSNHNGGCIAFSPIDGYLYIGMGDGGSADDPGCRAQKGGNLLGKMLRIDVDGGSPYLIPPDNPFVSDTTFLDEIYHFGIRNPWRFSFDRENGDLYIGDVGQNLREEISWQAGGSPGGLNYGWKVMEGRLCNQSGNCPGGTPACDDPAFTRPIKTYTHNVGCSVTGGFVYRGCAIPDLRGTYFYADFCSARIWSFRYDGTLRTEQTNRTAELDPPGGQSINSVTSFGEDGNGEMYIVDQGGEVFQIVPNGPAPAIDLGFGKIGSNGLIPEFSVCGLTATGSFAEYSLRFAPPSSGAALLVSLQNNPTPAFGGTLVTVPIIFLKAFLTDPAGEINILAPGGGGPIDLFMQWLIVDPPVSAGMGISNALQVTIDP